MYFLYAINSDHQTRLLNVLGQIAMIMGDKKNFQPLVVVDGACLIVFKLELDCFHPAVYI